MAQPPELTDDDVLQAMKTLEGFLDITPADFRELYALAYREALDRITSSLTAGDIMTTAVVAVNETTPLAEVAELMAEKEVSGVPVLDDSEVVTGVISEKDFMRHMAGPDVRSFMGVVARCLRSKPCLALPMKKQSAKDVMSTPAVTVRPETLMVEVAALLSHKGINRVPVVDEAGRPVGIVTRDDLVRASFGLAPSRG